MTSGDSGYSYYAVSSMEVVQSIVRPARSEGRARHHQMIRAHLPSGNLRLSATTDVVGCIVVVHQVMVTCRPVNMGSWGAACYRIGETGWTYQLFGGDGMNSLEGRFTSAQRLDSRDMLA